MKKIYTLLLTLGLGLSAMAQQVVPNVLFIGNSYTDVNNLPALVQTVAQSAGRDITYQANMPGGCTFEQHCSNQSMTLIQQGGWDFVVLQEQSQWPSFPWWQVSQGCFPYAAQLCEAVYRHNPDGEAMFYMTWGRQTGDPQWDSIATYEGMDDRIYRAYMYMKEQNDASVCPVGRVWRYIREHIPTIELYSGDGSHPSMAGSYAAACSFYTMLFHETPLNITYVPSGVDAMTAQQIRVAAKLMVFDSLDRWIRTPQQGGNDTTQTDTITPGDTVGHYVLFLGNSYTSVNNLPDLTYQLSFSAGHNMAYEAVTPGGCTFQQHCTGQGMQKIREGGWDYVVMQEQSQLPAFPDWQVAEQCMPYAKQLAEAIYEANPDGEAMFYMTWGRRDGDQQNASIFPPLGTYQGMDSLLYLRYMLMKMRYDASVSPVGRLWHYLRDNTTIELYQADGSHPTLAGSYAAACAFYTMIWHETPLAITSNAGLDDATALAIRQAADRVVFDSLFIWQRGGVIDTSFLAGGEPPVGIANPIEDEPVLRQEAYDLMGRRLQEGELPKGIYLVRYYTRKGCYTKKMLNL